MTTTRLFSFRLPRRRLILNHLSHFRFVATARCFFSLSARPRPQPRALRAAAPFRPRVPGGGLKPGTLIFSPTTNNTLPTVRGFRALRRLHSSKPSPSSPAASSQSGSHSLSQRLRKLFREYGWSALGVYLLLSALDFPFCFAAVRLLGVERIGHYEHVIVEGAKDVFRAVWPFNRSRREELRDGQQVVAGNRIPRSYNHGVREAEERNSGEGASIWTQLALAYAIHKSFIFIRVPLTAAVTPKVVKTLRQWGWDIGKRGPRSK
ncbi:hypothetical protein Egran_02359 [Elaphomyces granulatus]|uniref:DUF1279 domain-containing protein n=1 Tax=Elaphomyces granulatus TaxID=519963 RepID=A0A232M0P7_9EURO|nr:hypothetical protein Egran_02359 [Elaphomyces granulatus]